MNRDEVATAVVKSRFPTYIALYGFGSSGTEFERPHSDIDLALLLSGPTADLEPLRQDLEEKLGRNVDLIDMRQAPVVLAKEIVLSGRRLACRDAFEADLFELHILSKYQKLSQERADILAAGLQSGRFYGP